MHPASQRGAEAGEAMAGRAPGRSCRTTLSRTPLRSALRLARKVTGPTLCPCHRSVPGRSDAGGRFGSPFPFEPLTGSQRRPGHKQAPRPWPSPFERGPPYPIITYVPAFPVSRPATRPQGRLLRCAMGASPTACGAPDKSGRGLAASRARRRGTTDASDNANPVRRWQRPPILGDAAPLSRGGDSCGNPPAAKPRNKGRPQTLRLRRNVRPILRRPSRRAFGDGSAVAGPEGGSYMESRKYCCQHPPQRFYDGTNVFFCCQS